MSKNNSWYNDKLDEALVGFVTNGNIVDMACTINDPWLRQSAFELLTEKMPHCNLVNSSDFNALHFLLLLHPYPSVEPQIKLLLAKGVDYRLKADGKTPKDFIKSAEDREKFQQLVEELSPLAPRTFAEPTTEISRFATVNSPTK